MQSNFSKTFVINFKNKYILHPMKILNKPFRNKLSAYNNIMVGEITVRQHAHIAHRYT